MHPTRYHNTGSKEVLSLINEGPPDDEDEKKNIEDYKAAANPTVLFDTFLISPIMLISMNARSDEIDEIVGRIHEMIEIAYDQATAREQL